MFNNIQKSILCLSLLATPLLAQPRSFRSLTKRDDTLTLEIYMKESEFPSEKQLQTVNCTTTYPVGAKPVTLQVNTAFGAFGMFGNGLDSSTWTDTVAAYVLTRVPLRVDEGTKTFQIEGLGKGKDLNCDITLKQETEYERVAWILDRGLELFFDFEGKRDWAPGSDVLNITCIVVN